MRTLLLRVCIRAAEFWKLPNICVPVKMEVINDEEVNKFVYVYIYICKFVLLFICGSIDLSIYMSIDI